MRKHNFTAVLLTVLLILTLLAAAALPAAAENVYTFSDGYKSSKYCTALRAYNLTGDMRRDVVAVALTQLGYHEGDSDADFDGMNTRGGKNFVEYNRLYGKVDNGEGNGVSYGYAWCAAFVSWSLRLAGVPVSVACTEISCSRMVTWYKNNSTYHAFGDGYTPRTGDVIFFRSSRNTATSNHVGLVVNVSDGKVYTIEGNSGSVVCTHAFSLTDDYIVGYGVPAYTSPAGAVYDFPLSVSDAVLGEYVITASSLNVRSGGSTAFGVIGTLSNGARVSILEIENGWGMISYGGTTGWISMSYAALPGSIIYSVTYDACGGSPTPLPTRKEPGKAAAITNSIPTREGYKFLGWATKKDSGTAEYLSGAPYDTDADLALYAVWEPIIYTVSFLDYDGRVISEVKYKLYEKLTLPADPVRESDGEFSYTFDGWGTVPPMFVIGDAAFTAVYTSAPMSEEEHAVYAAAHPVTLPDAPDDKMSVLPIIIIAVSAVLLLAAAGIAVYFICRKRKRTDVTTSDDATAEQASEPTAEPNSDTNADATVAHSAESAPDAAADADKDKE